MEWMRTADGEEIRDPRELRDEKKGDWRWEQDEVWEALYPLQLGALGNTSNGA